MSKPQERLIEYLQPRPPLLAAKELGLLPCLLPALPRPGKQNETQTATPNGRVRKALRYLYACVSIGEHTHWIYLPLKQSLMIQYFQVTYTYPGLASLESTTGRGTESGWHESMFLAPLRSLTHAVCSPLSTIVPMACWDPFCIRMQVAMGKACVYLAIPTAL